MFDVLVGVATITGALCAILTYRLHLKQEQRFAQLDGTRSGQRLSDERTPSNLILARWVLPSLFLSTFLYYDPSRYSSGELAITGVVDATCAILIFILRFDRRIDYFLYFTCLYLLLESALYNVRITNGILGGQWLYFLSSAWCMAFLLWKLWDGALPRTS